MNEGTATTAIKRAHSSVDELLEGYTPQELEEACKIETSTGSTEYGRLLETLESYIDATNGVAVERILNSVDDVLTPEKINRFMQLTAALEHKERYTDRTGYFITRLIHNSYTAGNNDFTLDMQNLQAISNVGYELKGRKKRPIKITITGKVGNYCGKYAHHAVFNLDETENFCGTGTQHCVFNAKKVGDGCGDDSRDSKFSVELAGNRYGWAARESRFRAQKTGNEAGLFAENSIFDLKETGEHCGQAADNSTFLLGEVGHYCALDVQRCTFKTTNLKTLRQMLADAPLGSQVSFIDADGNEEVKRNYDE